MLSKEQTAKFDLEIIVLLAKSFKEVPIPEFPLLNEINSLIDPVQFDRHRFGWNPKIDQPAYREREALFGVCDMVYTVYIIVYSVTEFQCVVGSSVIR